MLSFRKFFVSSCIVCIFSSIFVSCEKPEQNSGLLPNEDLVNILSTDSFQIKATTQAIDSLSVSQSAGLVLGSYNDPIFGKVASELYLGFTLDKSNVAFGNDIMDLVADSLVVVLPYTSYYGNEIPTADAQTIEAYELTQKIELAQAYYSTNTIEYNPTLLVANTVLPKPMDSIINSVTNRKQAPQMRFKLDAGTAQRFLEEGTPGHIGLQNDANFQNFFKGVCLKSNTNQTAGHGGIATFNPITTKLVLYYHFVSTGKSSSFEFIVGSSPKVVNHFIHKYDGTEVGQALNNATNSVAGYVQGVAGTYMEVKFPSMPAFYAANTIHVAKAELTIKPEAAPIFVAPAGLFVLRKDATNNFRSLPEYGSGSVYNSVSYDYSKSGYVVNVTSYIQDILGRENGKTPQAITSGLYFLTANGAISPARAKFLLSNMKLKVYYQVVN